MKCAHGGSSFGIFEIEWELPSTDSKIRNSILSASPGPSDLKKILAHTGILLIGNAQRSIGKKNLRLEN
jgi:hypothetical protein